LAKIWRVTGIRNVTVATSSGGQKTRARGFTLIELLVVIAIIGIIAAILFPVFARARENARRATCQSNLKQIGLGLAQYSQDYDEKLPFVFGNGVFTDPKFVSDATDTSSRIWADALMPYIKSTQIFRCPSSSFTTTPRIDGSAPPAYLGSGTTRAQMSYGAGMGYGSVAPVNNTNGPFFYYPGGVGEARGRSIADFSNSADTLLISEYANKSNDNAVYMWTYQADDNRPGAIHFDGCNTLFADYHVKWMKPEVLNGPVNGVPYYYWLAVKP
jgi:prepilin-type N-terminal cleavage/methylation domain-containing protein